MSIKTVKQATPLPVNTQEKSKPSQPKLVNGYEYIPDPYKKVASGMEKQFAEFMISQMENSVGKTGGNQAENYYKSLMNSERANVMATKDQGLGLQKVILDQIYPQRMRNKLAYEQFQAQQDSRLIKRNDVKMQNPNVEGKEPTNE